MGADRDRADGKPATTTAHTADQIEAFVRQCSRPLRPNALRAYQLIWGAGRQIQRFLRGLQKLPVRPLVP
jgi:hypothetical protein